MELKVTVDGVERCISGLTEDTTCAQIIYAFAHATGQKGRFVLVERYRETEKSLAPTDRPLELLKKCDDNSQLISFVLKRLDSSSNSTTGDSYSFKSNTDSSYQNVFNNNFSQESFLPFVPERSSSPILKPLQQDQNFAFQQTSTFKPQAKKTALSEFPKSSSEASVRPSFLGLPRLVRSSENGTIEHFHSTSAISQYGSLRPRPPPPAYHQIIEERYNSLTRGCSFAIPRPSVWYPNSNQNDAPDAISSESSDGIINENLAKISANLTPSELERLIEDQQGIIEKQKALLLQLDVSTTDDDQRELLQLERQQANLHMVLFPLRARNLPDLLQKEKLELEKMRSMISDLQQKIENNVKILNEQSLLEVKLKEQIAALGREISDFETSTSTAEDTLDSPMREMLIS